MENHFDRFDRVAPARIEEALIAEPVLVGDVDRTPRVDEGACPHPALDGVFACRRCIRRG
jgi:hypothetical protein